MRWKRLHRAVYAVGMLAILHFFWMRAGKLNFGDVAVYAALLAVLLVVAQNAGRQTCFSSCNLAQLARALAIASCHSGCWSYS